MRCVACNSVLNDKDYKDEQYPGVEEDLCYQCKFVAHHPEFCVTHEYQFENITETPTIY